MRCTGFCVLVFLVSCGGAGRESSIQLLDSLQTQVKKLEAELHAFRKDSLRMAGITQEATQKLIVFPKVYQPDTVDVDVLLMMQKYRAYTLSAPRYNIRFQRIKAEIPYTLKQIGSLLTDLRNKALKNADVRKYTDIEKRAALRLMDACEQLRKDAEQTQAAFDSIRLPVNALIDSLQNDPVNLEAIRLKMLKAKTKKRK